MKYYFIFILAFFALTFWGAFIRLEGIPGEALIFISALVSLAIGIFLYFRQKLQPH